MRADPKPARRIVDRSVYRDFHAGRPRCRLCGKRPASAHHLVPRGQGGDDMIENLVPLCGDGTQGCHGEVEFRTPGYRERLRRALSKDEVAYVIERKGAWWLQKNYPR